MTRRTTRTALLARTALGVSLALLAAPALAQVSTNAGTITSSVIGGSGGVAVSGASSNTGGADVTTITLGGSRTILDWSGNLNLASGDTLNFVFGGRGDIVLNRVSAGSATIDGNLNGYIGATGGAYGGNVWFVSRDGVVFGGNARVNVGGLLATTGTIGDSNFLSDNFSFTTSPSTAVSVISGAQLNVHGGTLALIAPTVTTQAGAIINDATAGKGSDVLYGVADAYTITFAPDAGGDLDLFSWTVPVGSGSNVANPIGLGGTTTAGNVYLGAVSRNAVGGTVNITGSITANGAVASGDGNILLVGGGGISNGAASGIAGANVKFSGNGALTANRDVTVTGGGDVMLGAITGGNDVSLSSGGLLGTGTTTIGRHYTVYAQDFTGSLSPVWTGAVPHNYTITDTAFGLTQGNISVSGNLSITALNSGSLNFLGTLTSTGGDVTLTTQGSGSLSLGAVNAASGSVVLTSGSTITQTGAITAGTLRANAAGNVTLTNAGNSVGVLGASSSTGGAFALTDTGGLTVSGALSSFDDLTLSNNGALVINAPTVTTNYGTATFTGSSATFTGTTVGASYITVNGPTTFNGATMQSGGDQKYLGNVTLTGDASLNSAGPGWDILFNGTVNGAHDLTVTSKGSVHFNGAVGGSTALSSLNATGTQFGVSVQNPVTTTGAQTYNTLWMEADTTLRSTNAGAITLGRVNGAHDGTATNLTVNTAGTTSFGDITFSAYVGSVTTDAPGTTVLNGNVSVTGGLTFNDAVTLSGFTSAITAGGPVTFASTLDGNRGLTINTAGTTTFGGAVGATTALNSLTTDAGGTTVINGGGVRTVVGQTYGDAVVLGADTALTSTNLGAISFSGAVNGARSLTVNTGGATSFNGAVGGATALTALFTDAPGTTALNGGSITTTGAQIFGDAATLGANTTLTSTGSGTLRFATSVNGARSLTMNTAGSTVLASVGDTTALTSLTTDAAGSTTLTGGAGVRTSGAQTYNDNVTLTGTVALTSTSNGNIRLGGTVDSANGLQGLSVATGGTTSFNGAVGGSNALAWLNTDAAGTTSLGGAVTTTGAQSYADAVNLNAATVVLQSTGGGAVSFGSTLDGSGQLAVDTSGTTTFQGAVGATNALTSLTTQGGGATLLNGGSVRTTLGQSYLGALALGADTTLTSVNNSVIALNAVDGARGLTVNTGGTTQFNGAVGATTALTSLTTNAGGTTQINGGSIRTTGAQSYGDTTTVAAGGVLTADGALQFAALTGQGGLTLSSGGTLSVTGALSVSGDYTVTAADFTGNALAPTFIGTTNDFNITDTAGPLTIGAVTAPGTVRVSSTDTLTVTGAGLTSTNEDIQLTSAGALTLSGGLTTGGGRSVSLTSNGGAVTQTGGTITTGTLNATAAGTIDLRRANQIARFGALSAGGILTVQSNRSAGVSLGALSGTDIRVETTSLVPYELAGASLTASAGNVVLSGAGVTISSGTASVNASNLAWLSSVNGPGALNVTADRFTADDIGATTPLSSLNVTVGNSMSVLNGPVRTTGALTVDGDLWFSSANPGTTVSVEAGGALTLTGAVNDAGNGAHDLSLTSGGPMTIADVGTGSNARFRAVTVNNAATVTGEVRTTGAQVYGGAVTAADGAVFNGGSLSFGSLNGQGDLTLASTGTINVIGTVSVNGDYTVTAADFAGQALNPTFTGMGDFSITDTAGGLTLGALGTPGALTVTVLNGGLTVNGVVGAAGDIDLIADGDLTIASSGRVLGDDVRLSTDQAFVNQRGADAVGAAGRWLIYSAGPSGNTFGGLDSGNTAVWGRDISGAAVTQSGDRYVFAAAPTLTFTSTGGSKVYGDDGASVMGYTVSGLSGGVAGAFRADTLSDVISGGPALSSAGAAERASVAGGPYQVVVSAGDLQSLAGYQFAFNSAGQIVVTPRALTAGVVADSKTYDGTDAATGSITLGEALAGDEVGITGGTFTFDSRNAGDGRTVSVTGVTLTGDDAGNYTLSVPASVLADIYKREITGVVTANDKTYDGSAAGTGSVTLQGVLGGDSVGTTGATFTFADRNAGSDKVVTVSGVTLNGDDAGNYTLSLPASALADIFQKALTVTVVAHDKTYDGTTAGTGTVSLGGVVGADAVGTSTGTFTFADRNAGADKVVTVSGVTLTGADAGNYTVTIPASVLADIARRAVTVSANNASKTRGDADPALTWTLSAGSLVDGDSLTGALVRAPGEAVGLYAINQGDLAASANYVLTFNPGTFEIARPAVDPAQGGGGPVLQALTQPTPPSLGGGEVSVTFELGGGVPDGDTKKCQAGEYGCRKTN
ncbi:YDG domain-containing protein [Caulobacter sp. 17J80-11]|uniref:YDG domain-containing protein n=1 Tax=Caulobacter sp. 17J80-11 TaxID=2763502 RepID=UPI001653CDBE|nr:YDG domain-containing protein [Caulobacter sp. 17J80-11]MBC6981405.1 filamentous hemagglutinin N-terminal domain-containing protein [Caulobacter sp. 17J80-11]